MKFITPIFTIFLKGNPHHLGHCQGRQSTAWVASVAPPESGACASVDRATSTASECACSAPVPPSLPPFHQVQVHLGATQSARKWPSPRREGRETRASCGNRAGRSWPPEEGPLPGRAGRRRFVFCLQEKLKVLVS